jgi:hypothetical protein
MHVIVVQLIEGVVSMERQKEKRAHPGTTFFLVHWPCCRPGATESCVYDPKKHWPVVTE